MIVDLSYPLSTETPFIPGTPQVEIGILERTSDPPTKGRQSLNVTRLSMMVHTATHMDAPFHFFENGIGIDAIPLEQCIGPAVAVKLEGLQPREEVDLTAMIGLEARLRRAPKLILNTGWAQCWGTAAYFTDHPRLSERSAQLIRDCGVHLIGVDMPSVDRAPHPAHRTFLGSGMVIVENLTNLDAISNEDFHIAVLPLRIVGRDGSPVRAVAQFK
jgi:kynurenine formamidase